MLTAVSGCHPAVLLTFEASLKGAHPGCGLAVLFAKARALALLQAHTLFAECMITLERQQQLGFPPSPALPLHRLGHESVTLLCPACQALLWTVHTPDLLLQVLLLLLTWGGLVSCPGTSALRSATSTYP